MWDAVGWGVSTARWPDAGLPAVGARVQSEGSRATVRYVGAVEGQDPSKTWVGVQWDEPGRGKNDGSTGGVRYFGCPAQQGSFLKARKIEPRSAHLLLLPHASIGRGPRAIYRLLVPTTTREARRRPLGTG